MRETDVADSRVARRWRPLMLVGLALATGCAATDDPRSSTATAGSTASSGEVTTGSVPTPTPTDVDDVDDVDGVDGVDGVGTVRQVITDESRGRRLDTLVHYPTIRGRPMPSPLVLMAHGYRLPADGYERVLLALSHRGYVVAAPDFPHTTGNGGDGDRSDIVNQPADLVTVLDALSAGRVEGIPAITQPDRVAVMGHSDGGLTASALAYNTRYRDPRIAAAVVMTGGRALFPGSYFAPGSPPLLAVHGDADETNGYQASVSLWRDLPAGLPDYLVTVAGGSHLGPYMFDTGLPLLGEVVADFLDAHLAPSVDDSALVRLRADASIAPLSLRER